MGVNKKFDDLGRISLPMAFKKELGLKNGEEATVELIDDKIVITNPKRIKNKEEIKAEIKRIKDTDTEITYYEKGFLEALNWVLNEK